MFGFFTKLIDSIKDCLSSDSVDNINEACLSDDYYEDNKHFTNIRDLVEGMSLNEYGDRPVIDVLNAIKSGNEIIKIGEYYFSKDELTKLMNVSGDKLGDEIQKLLPKHNAEKHKLRQNILKDLGLQSEDFKPHVDQIKLTNFIDRGANQVMLMPKKLILDFFNASREDAYKQYAILNLYQIAYRKQKRPFMTEACNYIAAASQNNLKDVNNKERALVYKMLEYHIEGSKIQRDIPLNNIDKVQERRKIF